MKKFLTRIAVLMAAVLTLGACQLDKPQEYTFYYSLYLNVADEDAQTAVKEYFSSKIDFDASFTVYAAQYEAIQQANEQFLKDIEPIKNDEVLALIAKDDIVHMAMDIYTSKGRMGTISVVSWFHSDDEETGDGEEGSSGDGQAKE